MTDEMTDEKVNGDGGAGSSLLRKPELFSLVFSVAAAGFGWAAFGGGFGLAALAAGVLFSADVAVLRLIVSAFTKPEGAGKISTARAAALFIIKIVVLVLIAVFLIKVAELDILGFITGLTAGVTGIVTAGLISQSGTF